MFSPLLIYVFTLTTFLEAAKAIAEGTPEEVRNNPLVIASYLGTDKRAIDPEHYGVLLAYTGASKFVVMPLGEPPDWEAEIEALADDLLPLQD